MPEFTTLESAVDRHVRRGDTVHVAMGHHRWTALTRELARQHWGRDSQLTLVMASLSSLGVLLFRAGALRRVVTCYSGDSFPTYTPNPVYQRAYESGEVEVEHWSFLSLVQRLEAAARGLPAMVTGSLTGSSMVANDAYLEVETSDGPVSLVRPLAPDVTLLHGAVADRAGNVVLSPPLLELPWGAHAARRGAVVTVDAVVEDLSAWSHLPVLPAHRVLGIVEAPFGAHPGGLVAPEGLPVAPYAEDLAFWTEARDASRGDDLDGWIRHWCLDVPDQETYLRRLGGSRLQELRARSDPRSWKLDADAHPVDTQSPASGWEVAATLAAREVEQRAERLDADAVLAGAGVANLAAWVGVARARANGSGVTLTAELGLWDYQPTPADPFIFNLRSFPSSASLSDASHVLGVLVGGPGTTVIGCLGAAQVDRIGDLNSTLIPGGPFLVGSGGANDVASRAEELVVVTKMRPVRTPDRVGYVTSPGDRVRTVVTDRGVLRKHDGELRLAAVPHGEGSIEDRVRAAREGCGWDLEVVREVDELAAPTSQEVAALRDFDRERIFLG